MKRKETKSIWISVCCKVLQSGSTLTTLALADTLYSKVQRQPMEDGSEEDMSIPRVIIPKRGEKDFEPLAETVNLQEMMLQRSREALFGALVGVRGGNR